MLLGGFYRVKIQHNSRQIPSNKKFTANKNYSDLVYGYLQQKSKLDESLGVRYIPKKEIRYISMAEELGLSRQTISKKMKGLQEQGLLYWDEKNKRYVLTTLEAELAALLPCDTVRVLCVNLQERSLSILAYLIKTYCQHGFKPCEINIDIMKQHVGLNVDNRGYNNQVIKDILALLWKLGFINFHVEKTFDAKTGGFKIRYILDRVDNKVEFFK